MVLTANLSPPVTSEHVAIQWRPPLALLWGSELRIADVNGDLTAGQRWRSVLDGHLYLIAGWSVEHNMRAGYFGQSAAIQPGRPLDSMTRWTRVERRIEPRRIALVRFQQPITSTLLRLIEARTLMALSAARLLLLNTHTSAGTAGSRIARDQRIAGIAYATALHDALVHHVLDGRTNGAPPPAANSREAAVHVVLSADRALDTWEVRDRLIATGWVSRGRTPDFTIRRDLCIRERETPGTPRVFSTTHRNRRVYWNPALGKTRALAGYDTAFPPRTPRKHPDSTIQAARSWGHAGPSPISVPGTR